MSASTRVYSAAAKGHIDWGAGKNVQIRILRHRRPPSAIICDPKKAEIKKKYYYHLRQWGKKQNN